MIKSDETDSVADFENQISRLGKCEVCNANDAKYTCPKCAVKTCSVNCLVIHKRELECDGIRDKTKYIPMKKMTRMDLLSDYTFLEECTRFVEDRKRDKDKRFSRFNKALPPNLFKLRAAAHKRGTTLRFLLQNFSRNAQNTTYFDWNSQIIYWRVEWIFPNANNLCLSDERCCENEQLKRLVGKYIAARPDEQSDMTKVLQYYQARGMGGVKILLKAEGCKRSKNRFFELDPALTLKENLRKKTVIEFPTICVIFNELSPEFEIIDSDDDVETESRLYERSFDNISGKRRHSNEEESNNVITAELSEMNIAKEKAEKQRQQKELKKKTTTNLLFTDESLWDCASSDSDDGGGITEEEEMDTIEPSMKSSKKEDDI